MPRRSAETAVYLASPDNQLQASTVAGMPVLLSFALYNKWLEKGYQQSFSRVLIDSGAYSELNTGAVVDIDAYRDWAQRWVGDADAIAGLDDIRGDWRRSLRNYDLVPFGFPTIHDTDPPELLDELIPMAQERGGWIGMGLLPPRGGKEKWVRDTLARIPDDLHVHGWACREYLYCRRLDSVDSTNWWRDAMDFRVKAPWLTYAETLDIVVKRYQRERRTCKDASETTDLFSLAQAE